jgi:hypothetical protein
MQPLRDELRGSGEDPTLEITGALREHRSWLYRFFSLGRGSESLVSRWRHRSPPCRILGCLYMYPTALHVVLLTTPLRAHNDPLLRSKRITDPVGCIWVSGNTLLLGDWVNRGNGSS